MDKENKDVESPAITIEEAKILLGEKISELYDLFEKIGRLDCLLDVLISDGHYSVNLFERDSKHTDVIYLEEWTKGIEEIYANKNAAM